MESRSVLEKIERNELLQRTLSLFLLAPMIALVVMLSDRGFWMLCWFAYFIMGLEIFSPQIQGKVALRTAMLVFCFFGIKSFIYCRQVFGPMGCVMLICIASFSDMGGYFVGRTFGGPKLCPKVSPNKTWSGFCGSVICANLGGVCVRHCMVLMSEDGALRLLDDFGVMQLLVLSTVAGDLLESYFKRRIGVKDMSKLFPGHGGFLDRLDSLLMISVVCASVNVLL